MKKLVLVFGLLALIGAGCASSATPSAITQSDRITIDDVAVYQSPAEWARYWNIDQGWSFRYPEQYTALLDWTTGIVTIGDGVTGEPFILVRFENDELTFEEVVEGTEWFEEIVGTTKFDE